MWYNLSQTPKEDTPMLEQILEIVKAQYDSYRVFEKDGVTHIFAVKGKETTVIVIHSPSTAYQIPS